MDAYVIVCIFKDRLIFGKSRQTHMNIYLSILQIRSLTFQEALGEKTHPPKYSIIKNFKMSVVEIY